MKILRKVREAQRVTPHDPVSGPGGDRSWGATSRHLAQSNRTVRAACALALLLSAGCPATSEEVRPPADQFYFPTGMDISPDQEILFVANANSDLRFDGGTVIPVSLDRVDAGRLFITSKRVIYEGDKGSVTLRLRDISSYQVFADGIVLERRTASGPHLLLDGDVELTAVILGAALAHG